MILYKEIESGALFEIDGGIRWSCGVPRVELKALEPSLSVPPSKDVKINEATGEIDGHERIED